ncbi:MAG: preprotein translocase subunit SecG [Lachnospiraceae bacterium]|nr:preprotein translocase subunit SecG [Lachnospiraceae bacterium]
MVWVIRILKIVLVLICGALMVLILMQDGKNAGLGGGISGGYSQTYVGKHRKDTPEGKMQRYTAFLIAAFFVASLLLNVLGNL